MRQHVERRKRRIVHFMDVVEMEFSRENGSFYFLFMLYLVFTSNFIAIGLK